MNRSFEQLQPIPYWSTYAAGTSYELSDVGAHGGTYSLHILPAGAALSQSFTCSAGTAYTLSGFYKVDLQQTGNVSVTGTGVNSTLQYALNWTSFSYSFTCSGTQTLQITGNRTPLNGGLSSGTVWFDDITLAANGVGNLVVNPGFESAGWPVSWSLYAARASKVEAHEGVSSV